MFHFLIVILPFWSNFFNQISHFNFSRRSLLSLGQVAICGDHTDKSAWSEDHSLTVITPYNNTDSNAFNCNIDFAY